MSIKDLNCMIHYGDGNWMPAQRLGFMFYDPAGNQISEPAQCKDMSIDKILQVMDGVKRERDRAAARKKEELQ